LVTEQVELVTMIQVPLIIFYAGWHVQFIAVDLSTIWSGPAVNTVLPLIHTYRIVRRKCR